MVASSCGSLEYPYDETNTLHATQETSVELQALSKLLCVPQTLSSATGTTAVGSLHYEPCLILILGLKLRCNAVYAGLISPLSQTGLHCQ